MKEKKKRIIAGILAASIALGIPANVQQVDAAGRTTASEKIREDWERKDKEDDTGKDTWLMIPIIETETIGDSEILSEDMAGDNQETASEIVSEELSDEDLDEEKLSDEKSKGISGENQELTSEFVQEKLSDEDLEKILLEEYETISINIEELIQLESTNLGKQEYTFKNAEIVSGITDGGEFDYRTYIASGKRPELSINLLKKSLYVSHTPRGEDSDALIPLDELTDIKYQVAIENTDVVRPEQVKCKSLYSLNNISKKGSYIYEMSENVAEFVVCGVGKTDYQISLCQNDSYNADPVSGSITVNNSSLYDNDFYIEVPGSNKKYTFDEWKEYLRIHSQWVNGDIAVKLSDEGQRYYTDIKIETEEPDHAVKNCPKSTNIKKEYVFWAENPSKNACTKEVENGTRTFTAAIDKSAPVLRNLAVDGKCYAPTKTDTMQYFGQDFVLKGKFEDPDSGVSRIEYTTDVTLKEDAVWVEAATVPEAEVGNVDFTITLQDGCYDAIAVRAYDYAGNISGTKGFVNDNGEYIKVVVDKSEPVMNISVTSDNLPYIGENESWTNSDIDFEITLDKNSCPYAGIYKCEYAYDTIGEAVNDKNMTGLSEKWTELTLQDMSAAGLEIREDKNGYFYFRVISKSGVASKEVAKKRVLLQHEVPDIKPIIVNNVDDTKRKNNWYNKQSGVPEIHFEYPDYDSGVTSTEYDAPVTIHYRLTIETDDTDKLQPEQENADSSLKTINTVNIEKSASMGVMSSSDVSENADGLKKFVVTKDDLDKHVINFGYDATTKEAQDGIYTLEYWITDKAGNMSEKHTQVYEIDCHEPTDLTVELEGGKFPVGQESSIVYEKFYQENVSGNVSAQYGISKKGSLAVLKAKKIGEWNDISSADLDTVDDTGVINIAPNIRCFFYVRAEDNAGNVAEGWTRGIVVDNMAPNQENGKELIIEPVGANKHGFFNDDVKVEVRVQDAPEDDNCAALMTVSSSIGKDGKDTITNEELFSFTKELPTDDELVSAFGSVQLVNAKENESNEAYIEVTATDRSGNTKTSTQLLKIDVTKPQIDISFDNNNAVNGNFYNDFRTATIRIQELNFDPSAVDVLVTKDGQAYDFGILDWKSDGSKHYATIAFLEDGEYTMEASCTDLADNESDKAKTETFIIDRTAPVLTIRLDSAQDKLLHGNYFNTAVTAVITVTEHNFSEDDLVMDIAPASKKGMWSHDGDVHTLHLVFDGDNAYHIACAYTDLAGNSADSNNPANKAEENFVIDTLAPIIFIEGIEDGSANRGPVLPVISVLDFNMEAQETTISVTTAAGDKVENAIETTAIDDESGIGYRFTLVNITDKEDNIYYLTVSACDKAGNESTLTYRFSLNRKGSAYDLTQIMDLMDRQYITYTGLGDIQIVEMNIDTVEDFEIYISRNGELGYNAVYSKEVDGSADIGYTYIYHVKSENFAQEGTYRLSLYSRDRAGNEVNNTTDINGNEISFIVDNTAPKVVFDGIEAGMVYDVESQEVHVSVTDNFKLSEAELILVNKANDVIDSWNYMELAGEGRQMDLVIPQYNGELSLLYRVKDAAGNEVQTFQGEQTALSNFLVTTDKFVQFINKPSKTPFGQAILVLAGAAGLITAIGLCMRRRNGLTKG